MINVMDRIIDKIDARMRDVMGVGGAFPKGWGAGRALRGTGRLVAPLALGTLLAWGAVGGASPRWGLDVPRAQAQELQAPEASGITVIGDGSATAQPDTTTIRLGVEVTAQTPAEALSRTREGAERVVQRLRERGVPEGDVQTSGLNVFPIQAPTREGPPDPTAVRGYRGNASITAQARDVAQVGALLDASIEAGATSVQGLSFGIRDDSALRRQALVTAIAAARPKAEAAAGAAGLTITGVRAIVEQPYGPPAPRAAGGLGGGAAEGIAPGELTVVVRAQVTFDVAR